MAQSENMSSNTMNKQSSSQRSNTMKHTQILKQAWRNVVSYRTLWIFGIILALTTFGGSWMYMMDRDDRPSREWEGIQITPRDGETVWQAVSRTLDAEFARADREIERFFRTEFGIRLRSDIQTYLTIFAATVLVLWILGRIARYVSETALIQMVNRHDETGEKLGFRRGLALGWSRPAWRLFLINLVVTITAILAIIALFALILSPIALWEDWGETANLVGGFLTGSLCLLAIAATILFAGLVSLVKLMAHRAAVVEGMTVFGAIRRGYLTLRGNLKDMVSMGVVTLGIKTLWPLLIGMTVLVLLGGGLLIGALPAAILANLSDPATLPAAILGGAAFFLVLFAPLTFLQGMLEVFFSSVWTLAYRQLRGLESQASQPAPEAPVPGAALPVPGL
jgi:hypothetical protein